jgi:hypothetical protein
MRPFIIAIMLGTLVSACSPGVLPISPSTLQSTAADADALSGLPDSYAAHPSVELSAPRAFVLTAESAPFVAALARQMDPVRSTVASALMADPSVKQGIGSWERSTGTAQFAVLKQVAAVTATAMGCRVPAIVSQTGQADTSGTMAFYQSGNGQDGEITLYPAAFARGGKYLAIATVVHEMRHAAQDQLIESVAGTPGPDADLKTLADGYTGSWRAVEGLGSESQLAYGDYVHLTFEYDAFQTGNQVATLLSQGSFDSTGNGFVDVRYQAGQAPLLNLLDLATRYSGRALIAAVNTAEYQAERTRSTPVTRPGPTTVRQPRRTWR